MVVQFQVLGFTCQVSESLCSIIIFRDPDEHGQTQMISNGYLLICGDLRESVSRKREIDMRLIRFGAKGEEKPGYHPVAR